MTESGDQLVIRADVASWLRRLFFFCLAVELLIVLCDIILNHYQLIPWAPLRRSFNITREDALGNWWSSTLELATGLSLWLLMLRARSGGKGKRSERLGWGVLALFFTYMAVDDATKLHERVGSSMAEMAENVHGTENVFAIFPSYAWQLVFGPLLVGMSLFLLWFLWRHLRTRPQRLGMLAGFACLAVAVLMDLVEGMDTMIPAMSVHGVEHFMKLVEEFLEMVGITFFLTVFLSRLLHGAESIRLELV